MRDSLPFLCQARTYFMNHDQPLDKIFERDVFVRQFIDGLHDISSRESGGHVGSETVKEILIELVLCRLVGSCHDCARPHNGKFIRVDSLSSFDWNLLPSLGRNMHYPVGTTL